MTQLHSTPTAEQIGELHAANWKRIHAHNMNGVGLPGVEEHYLEALLEALVPPDLLLRIKYEHEVWTTEQIDNLEASIRMGILNSPSAASDPRFTDRRRGQ